MGSVLRKGSKETGQSGGISQEQADLARIQARLAQEQAAITKPLREGTANILTNFLNTGQTPGFLDLNAKVSPLAALGLAGVESEQLNLRRSLMAQGNRGGQLQQALANSAMQGGIQRTGLMQQDVLRQEQRDIDRSNIARTLFGGASDQGTGGLAMAFQGLGQSMQGTGQAANNLNILGAQRMQQNKEFQQGVGEFAGRFMPGLKKSGAGASSGTSSGPGGTAGKGLLGIK